MTVVTIGFLLFISLLTVVVVNSSAAFLERQRLDNIADGAALAAADGLSRETFYQRGEVTLDDAQARELVDAYVTAPGVRVEVRTEANRVHVRLRRSIGLAIAPPGWQSRTTITSESTAQLRPAP